MPRSLAYCYHMIAESLDFLAEDYGQQHDCHGTLAGIRAKLKPGSIASIFDGGLHEFLSDFIISNNRLGNEVAENYRFF